VSKIETASPIVLGEAAAARILHRVVSAILSTMSVILELWRFLKTRKKFWLLPILLMLFLFAFLLVLAPGTALGPFLYTLF
jgi:uncharacterized membrane protein